MRQQDLVADWLTTRAAELLTVEPEDVPWDTPFVDLGLSSVQAVELSEDLRRWTGLNLSPTLAYDYPTILAAAAYIAEKAEAEGHSLSRPVVGEPIAGSREGS